MHELTQIIHAVWSKIQDDAIQHHQDTCDLIDNFEVIESELRAEKSALSTALDDCHAELRELEGFVAWCAARPCDEQKHGRKCDDENPCAPCRARKLE